MMTIISIALYLTDKGERTVLYKIYKNVLIKPKNVLKRNIVLLAHHTYTPTPKHAHPHSHMCTQKNCTGEGGRGKWGKK